MRIIKSQLILLAIYQSFIGCVSDTCNEPKALEAGQGQFVNELISVNGLSASDVYYSTQNGMGCETPNIYTLTVSNKSLKSIPSSIASLKYLRSITLYNDSLDSLPSALISLRNLESIDVDSNSICSATAEMDAFLSKINFHWAKTQKCP